MPNRNGEFIGVYIRTEVKRTLERRAASAHRTLSGEIRRILEGVVGGNISISAESINCVRCGHTWTPRGSEPPVYCASCGREWDKPRRREVETKSLLTKREAAHECGVSLKTIERRLKPITHKSASADRTREEGE